MRKLVALFFLLLLLLQSGGSVWWFKIKQTMLQMERSERLLNSASSLVTILVSEKEFIDYSLNDGEEIILQGKLYDIKQIERVEGKIKLTALNDSEEENLILSFMRFIRSSNKNSKQIPIPLTNLLLLTYIAPTSTCFLFKLPPEKSSVEHCFFASKTFQSTISSPPPKQIS